MRATIAYGLVLWTLGAVPSGDLLAVPRVEGIDPPAEPIILADDQHLIRLQEGLWIHVSDFSINGRPISANGLVLANEGGVAVIDTPWTEEQTRRLMGWMEREIARPIRFFVLTHAHPDRLGGIGAVHEREIATYAGEVTVELAEQQAIEPPENSFSGSLDLRLGEEKIRLVHPGGGHSPDNIVVWFEDRRLLFGGCFIKSAGSKSLGYTGDADLEAWPVSLDRVRRRFPETSLVVPGHGAPGGMELFEHTGRLLEAAAESARR